VFSKVSQILVIGQSESGWVVRNLGDLECKDVWVIPFDIFKKTYQKAES
jgi:hypothetical protein